MKAGKTGLVSALIASSCCILPSLLILAGIGSIGFAAQFSQYDWVFATAGISLLGFSYWQYFRERKTCTTGACQMKGKKFTQISLGLSTLVIVFAVGVIAFSHISVLSTNASQEAVLSVQPNDGTELATLKIENMTCLSCAWSIEARIKQITGVVSAQVEFSKGLANIQYRPQQAAPEQFVKTVEGIGYRASLVPSTNQSHKASEDFSDN